MRKADRVSVFEEICNCTCKYQTKHINKILILLINFQVDKITVDPKHFAPLIISKC